MNASDFSVVLPEVLLSLYAMLALVVFVYTGKDKHAVFSIWLTSGVLILLAAIIGLANRLNRQPLMICLLMIVFHASPKSSF